MLLHGALVGTDVSEEHIASIFRVTRIGDLGRTLEIANYRGNSSHSALVAR
jgi:hypothetical protein